MTAPQTSMPGMSAYRARSLFQPHCARQAIRDAHQGIIPSIAGIYLGLSTVPTARFIAPLGFDAVCIDSEHSSCHVETMTTVR
jgi:4-hydroxy-2-oxoheptanedioate aldolase